MQHKTFSYRVESTTHTTHDVIVLELLPASKGITQFIPGQFVMVRILNPDGTLWKQKAYSMCNIPNDEGRIELGVKVAGEFTQRLNTLKVGDKLELAGPYGIFTIKPEMGAVVFLAGGIGITPFLSMIRGEIATNSTRRMTLLYANKSPKDIAFQQELEFLAKVHPLLRVAHTIESGELTASPVPCHSGRVTEELLRQYGGDMRQNYYLLCGPPPFMDCMKEYLSAAGVDPSHIKVERFT